MNFFGSRQVRRRGTHETGSARPHTGLLDG
jgi:hypothetical protein